MNKIFFSRKINSDTFIKAIKVLQKPISIKLSAINWAYWNWALCFKLMGLRHTSTVKSTSLFSENYNRPPQVSIILFTRPQTSHKRWHLLRRIRRRRRRSRWTSSSPGVPSTSPAGASLSATPTATSSTSPGLCHGPVSPPSPARAIASSSTLLTTPSSHSFEAL